MDTSPHLLIVDDDREIRDLLSRFLRKHGFRVSVAVGGREMWPTGPSTSLCWT